MTQSRFLSILAAAAALVFSVPSPVSAQGEDKLALVYNGAFASGAQDFQGALVSAGYRVEYFTDVNSLSEGLGPAALVLFPGTNDAAGSLATFVGEFRPETVRAIAGFVNGGGTYLGVCGGAYIIAREYRTAFDSGTGLGLVPVVAEGFRESDAATILNIRWKDRPRTIYYQLGPRFLGGPEAGARTIATYSDGSAAACSVPGGAGRYLLVGPHPEVLAPNLEPKDIPDGTLENLTDTSDLLADFLAEAGS